MSTTKTVTTRLNPLDWGDQKIILYLGYLQTTGNSFGANITIKGNNFSQQRSVPFNTRAFSFFNVENGNIVIPKSAFPITISAEIQCSTNFDTDVSFQRPLGQKTLNSKDVPISYQTQIFCNDNVDGAHDNDFNDFVLISQLYNATTDG